MDRRNFLAFIPSLSAIPLIGKEIVQEKERISIIKPEPIKISQPDVPLRDLDLFDCELKLIHKPSGRQIATGYLRSITIDAGHPVFPSTKMIPPYRQIDIEGTFYDLVL